MKQLQAEANRCLQCKNPRCQKHCPINTFIPQIIEMFKKGKIMEAGEVLFENNPLSAVCAIVCPHEDQCKGNCIVGIKGEPVRFCDIEKYVSEHYLRHARFQATERNHKMIAIIGGGPAGITLAFLLAKKGYDITIFDAHEKIGGILRYGIPEYRLPNDLIDCYKERLMELGVQIRPNTLIGPVITIDKLFSDGYEAIFIGTGVWNPKPLNMKGETLGNVHYAIDYLKSPNVYDLGEHVVVIGAGNVAMDAARTAKRNGANKVTVLYRKGFENMTCTKKELEEAIEDQVSFSLFKAPLELCKDGVRYIETRNQVVNDRVVTETIEGSEGMFYCDSIIIAISQNPRNNIVSTTTGLETNAYGLLTTDEYGHTTRNGVFASGDVVTGAKTVVEAAANAKVVAKEIEKYINHR